MSSSASNPTEPKVLLDGLAYVESPRWHDGRFWFAHWGTGEIVAVDLDGHSEVVGHGPPSQRRPGHASAGPSTGCPTAAFWSPARSCCAGSRTGRWSATPTSAGSPSTAGTRSWSTAAATSTSTASDSASSPASRPPRDHRARHAGRDGPPGRGRLGIPQRHGGHAGQRNADHLRVLRRAAHRVRHRRRRQPVQPAGCGPRGSAPTVSAWTPRAPSGSRQPIPGPTLAGHDALGGAPSFESARAARCWSGSSTTARSSPSCSAAWIVRRSSCWLPSGAASTASTRRSLPGRGRS